MVWRACISDRYTRLPIVWTCFLKEQDYGLHHGSFLLLQQYLVCIEPFLALFTKFKSEIGMSFSYAGNFTKNVTRMAKIQRGYVTYCYSWWAAKWSTSSRIVLCEDCWQERYFLQLSIFQYCQWRFGNYRRIFPVLASPFWLSCARREGELVNYFLSYTQSKLLSICECRLQCKNDSHLRYSSWASVIHDSRERLPFHHLVCSFLCIWRTRYSCFHRRSNPQAFLIMRQSRSMLYHGLWRAEVLYNLDGAVSVAGDSAWIYDECLDFDRLFLKTSLISLSCVSIIASMSNLRRSEYRKLSKDLGS